jgi:hypothetical protein
MMHQITVVAQGILWGKRTKMWSENHQHTNGGVFHIYLASSLTRGYHQEKKLQKKTTTQNSHDVSVFAMLWKRPPTLAAR